MMASARTKTSFDDDAYGGDNVDFDIPSATLSEQRLAEKAPAAINVLRENGQLDLLEMLGLSSHYKR